jgi:hypothetical protein
MTSPGSTRSDNGSPTIRALIGHVRAFVAMMRTLNGTRDFPQWIKRVEADDLPSLLPFTTGIQRDLAAVTAGLSLPPVRDPWKDMQPQDDQASDVRPSQLRSPAPPFARTRLMADAITELCQSQLTRPPDRTSS